MSGILHLSFAFVLSFLVISALGDYPDWERKLICSCAARDKNGFRDAMINCMRPLPKKAKDFAKECTYSVLGITSSNEEDIIECVCNNIDSVPELGQCMKNKFTPLMIAGLTLPAMRGKTCVQKACEDNGLEDITQV